MLRLMLKRKHNGMTHTCPDEARTFFNFLTLRKKQHSLQPLSEGLWPPTPQRCSLTTSEMASAAAAFH